MHWYVFLCTEAMCASRAAADSVLTPHSPQRCGVAESWPGLSDADVLDSFASSWLRTGDTCPALGDREDSLEWRR